MKPTTFSSMHRIVRMLRFVGYVLCIVQGGGATALRASGAPADLKAVCVLSTQAYLCDIAGTGEVVESRPKGFRIVVDNYWVGNSGTNVLDIAVDADPPPSGHVPIVFFASTNAYFKGEVVEPLALLCQWSFLTNRTVGSATTELGLEARTTVTNLQLLADSLSWFNVSADGGLLLEYASNLVHHARTQVDHQVFYETVRDGARLPPATSPRIYADSIHQLMHWGSYESEEYLRRVWVDPLITGRARGVLRWGIQSRFQWDDL